MPSRLTQRSAIHLGRRPPDERDSRVDQLLDALLVIGSGLELQDVLLRIVEVAVSLVDAEFGALGVLDAGGDTYSQFVTAGIDDELTRRIGPLPSGRGLLGEVIRRQQPVRLTDLTEHEASCGFPEHHPSMSSFLGVPVRVSNMPYGTLYLTQKRGGRDFDAEDESIVVALALAAGLAIHNVRLYDESRRQRAWLEAGREISLALMAGTARAQVMDLVVDRAREVLGATMVFTAFHRDGQLLVQASSGTGHSALNEPGALGELTTWAVAVVESRQGREIAFGASCGLMVPLGWPGGSAAGALVALWPQRPDVAWTRDLTDFAAQAGLALELAERRDAAERTAVVEDGQPSFRARILKVISAGSEPLGFAATVQLVGLLDTMATPEIAEHVLATLQEALSNAARHARASAVDVLVAVRGDALQVRVHDNGCGMAQDGVRRGLRNLAVRAERLGGSFQVTSVPEEGTTLLWQVPI